MNCPSFLATPREVHGAQFALAIGVALESGLLKPRECQSRIPVHTAAIPVSLAQGALGLRIAPFGSVPQCGQLFRRKDGGRHDEQKNQNAAIQL